MRRPLQPGSEWIHRLLTHFERCGFDGVPRFTPARMLRAAVDAYGWSGPGLVDAMLAGVRHFQEVVAPPDRAVMEWGAEELAHLEDNADLFRAWLEP